MITLDAIRTAVLAPDPYTRMDDLVRAEMTAGRKVREIFDDINPLVNTVLDIPGLTEDGEEAFLGTLDALTGNCHRDSCYYDPPNTSLPTEEEIAQLPRWARVAFAARCARRVLPLYAHYWPSAPTEHVVAVHYSVRIAELGGEAAARFGDSAKEAAQAAWSNRLEGVHGLAEVAAATASHAAFARGGDELRSVIHAVESAGLLVTIRPQIRRDFAHLARLAEWQRWTDDTPVSPEVFGPLWPEGPPPGWPVDPDTPRRIELSLAFLARDGTLPVVLEGEVVNLFNALNRYYILRTGDRLTVDGDIHTLLAALNPAGVS